MSRRTFYVELLTPSNPTSEQRYTQSLIPTFSSLLPLSAQLTAFNTFVRPVSFKTPRDTEWKYLLVAEFPSRSSLDGWFAEPKVQQWCKDRAACAARLWAVVGTGVGNSFDVKGTFDVAPFRPATPPGIFMLNLLHFKSHNPGSYVTYAETLTSQFLPRINGGVMFFFLIQKLVDVIGFAENPYEGFDAVGLVGYPKFSSFVGMVKSEAYLKVQPLRDEAIVDGAVLATRPVVMMAKI
ncbi:hypothetical protein HK104_000378 [Borealophlyctis nickersoniae]|nr:hypothetical protein HK104_000378 [Borealophlyctis nickersoniae]